MRLLQLRADNELVITRDLVRDIPPYAILSHTWGADDEEVKLQDVVEGKGKGKPGYQKILFCGQQARLDGLEYFWVDTCCIDKTNSVELTEAINSMFRWYQIAQKCYVYLADVLYISSQPRKPAQSTWETEFRKSRWFSRGWTLQELIAPVVVEFYSVDRQRLGDKRSLEQTLHEITRIPIRALQGGSLSDFDFDTRISWSMKRVTSKEEDRAYSLISLLGLSMSLIYGEGEQAAFRRLRREHANQPSLTLDPQLEASIDQCLAHLRVSDPRDDRSRIESTKGGLLKDSYRWILEHEDFKQWRGDRDSHLLWIKGDPGKGKTMLLCGIIEELSGVPTDQCLVTYFFCQATDTSLNNATAVLRGLIYMLVRQDRSLAKHLHEEWKIAGQRLFEDANAWDALIRILASILQYDRPGKLVFVIDALDECIKDRAKLLDFVTSQSQNSQAKWLVSSRNWPEIEEQLNAATQKVRLSLELNTESISAAVKIYIRYQVERLQRIKNLSEPMRNDIVEYLVSNADDTFLWVALVCERLRDPGVRARHIMQELRCYPSGLDPLYNRMLQYIDNSKDSELCREILGTVAATYRPLSLIELTVLIESDSLDFAELREITGSCGSFLTIREDVVYFVHQSVKEFLTKSTASTIFTFGVRRKHASISMLSMKALLHGLRRDMYNLRKPGISIEQVQTPSPDPLAPLRYSCIFWVDHITEGYSPNELQPQEDINEIGLAYQVLQEKFLYWVEALSLIRNVPSGVSSIAKLLQLSQDNDEVKHFRELFYDAFRILQYYGAIIAQYPLQAYITTLVFSPAESVLRRSFQQEGPRWCLLKPHVEQQWGAHLRTLEGHSSCVSSVAFSPDGKTVASASYDETVRLWEASTGELQRTLKGHSGWVLSVAISPDGKTVASASNDKTIRLWEASTGELQRTLKGHSSWVWSVAISPNGKTVASASHDKTVRLWEASTGELQRTLEGHSESVLSVAFSPDSKTVASASYDETICFWKVNTGELQRTLEGHSELVWSVAFSPDGKTVASASRDETVRLWEASTNELQRTFEGHSSSVWSVAISPNGKTVASASHDKTVRLWEASTGELQQTLKGHSNIVSSVAFSPDGKTVASASHDETVRLWEASTGELQRTLEGHSGLVVSVAISPDGKTVASASHDKMVRLWDVNTSELLQALEIGSYSNTISFNADSSQVFTDAGAFSIQRPFQSVATEQIVGRIPPLTELGDIICVGYGVSRDGKWINFGGENILWLPAEYRPHVSAVVGLTVVFGCGSGRLLIMQFHDQAGS